MGSIYSKIVEILMSGRFLPFSQHPWGLLSCFYCQRALAEFERCFSDGSAGGSIRDLSPRQPSPEVTL